MWVKYATPSRVAFLCSGISYTPFYAFGTRYDKYRVTFNSPPFYGAKDMADFANLFVFIGYVMASSTNGADYRSYINGEENPNIYTEVGNPSNFSNDMIIGGGMGIGCSPAYGGPLLQGIIDEFRIYNRALSDSEIKALYDATK